MADTEIRFPGMPTGLTATVRVRNADTLAILETVTLSESGNYYTGDVTGAHAGQFVFETLISGTVVGASIRTIADDAGPYIIHDAMEMEDSHAAIKDRTDRIGSVTFLLSGGAVASDGSMVIKAGDRHVFTITSDTEDVVPDLTGNTIRFGIKGNSGDQLLSKTTDISIEEATGFQSVEVTILPAESILLPQGAWHFDVQAEYSATDVRTFVTGSVTVKSDYSGTAA